MKKIVALALVLMMAVPAFAMTAGTYEGEAMGKMGNVKVSVVVTENAIESVTVVSHNETEGFFKPVEETIPAAIVEKQALQLRRRVFILRMFIIEFFKPIHEEYSQHYKLE